MMAIVKVNELGDRVQDWLRNRWGYTPDPDEIVDTDLLLEELEIDNRKIFDEIEKGNLFFYLIKNPEKYRISRWELMDI